MDFSLAAVNCQYGDHFTVPFFSVHTLTEIAPGMCVVDLVQQTFIAVSTNCLQPIPSFSANHSLQRHARGVSETDIILSPEHSRDQEKNENTGHACQCLSS